MPRDYDVLLRRSIFGRGTARVAAERPAGPPPEGRWVLRGVLHQEGRFTAFVEDLSARTLRRLRAGDKLAPGGSRAWLDGLAYEAASDDAGHIGQDLRGNGRPPRHFTALNPPRRAGRGRRGNGEDHRPTRGKRGAAKGGTTSREEEGAKRSPTRRRKLAEKRPQQGAPDEPPIRQARRSIKVCEQRAAAKVNEDP